MDESALQRRLDAVLILLVTIFLLVLAIAVNYMPKTTIGVLIFALPVGYGLVKSTRDEG